MANRFFFYNPSTATTTAGAIQFVLDGANADVTKDSGTPANNIPLPVQLIDTSGNLNTVTIAGTVPLPTGAATAAKQDTGNTSLASIDGKLASLGQKAMAGSAPVVIASDQSAIPASQSGTWNITNISGTVSLPTGASTGAKQDTGNTSLASIDGKFGSLGQKAMAGSAPVVIASDQSAIPASQSGTWNITNISGTVSLPTGAATGAKQDTGNTSLASIDGKFGSLGQKAMAGSAPVVLASDQSAIATKAPVNAAGSSPGSGTVSTVATLTAPGNTVGFVLMNLDTSTANIRYRIGATATNASGQQLQPGRDTGYIPCAANISICAESGTQNYDVQFILSA